MENSTVHLLLTKGSFVCGAMWMLIKCIFSVSSRYVQELQDFSEGRAPQTTQDLKKVNIGRLGDTGLKAILSERLYKCYEHRKNVHTGLIQSMQRILLKVKSRYCKKSSQC